MVAGVTPIELIVGLGNPGNKYTATRHNAGFWFLDQVARQYQTDFQPASGFKADVAAFNQAGQRVWLLRPNTFMNLSGAALAPFASYYQIAPQNILVIHDELDLAAGIARYKLSGGHGGHNGLRNIFECFGKDFWRLRIGIGHPGRRQQVLPFVMQAPSSEQKTLIDDSLSRALDTLPQALAGDMQAAMRGLHQN